MLPHITRTRRCVVNDGGIVMRTKKAVAERRRDSCSETVRLFLLRGIQVHGEGKCVSKIL